MTNLALNDVMEKIIPIQDNGALEAVTGEYAVLPSRLSRHTRILNAGMRNRLRHTSLCLETQRRKFCTYHSVEAAKHHAALLNLRKSLKTRPWRVDVVADTTPDAFTADISHLNPVELSRFKLVREIVAAIPGEKVRMGEICDTISHIGGVYTEDRNRKAVQIRPQSRRSRTRHASPKTVGIRDDNDQGILQSEPDTFITMPEKDQSEDLSATSETSEGTTAAVSVTSIDGASTITEDTRSQISGKETVSDSSIQLTDEHDVSETISMTSSQSNFSQSTSSAQNPKPVFITEVGYIPLKSRQRKVLKVSGVRKFRSMFPEKTKVHVSAVEKGQKLVQPNPIRPVPEKLLPVIRNTDPYGLGYSGSRVENVSKTSTQASNKYGKSVKSNKSLEYPKPVTVERPSSRSKGHLSVARRTSNNSIEKAEETKSCKVKTITWKEPICSTEIGFHLDKNTQSKWNSGTQVSASQPPKPIMKGARSHPLPSLHTGEMEVAMLGRSKDSSPLSYLILHEDTENICNRHRRWLVKTPDYLP